MRIIFHVDMDSFFSAIEVREQPELKGLPVIVGGRIQPKETETAEAGERNVRGVVSTCSYEARAFGIHSAMALSRAYKLCPDAIVLPVRMALYKHVSEAIMSILRKYADTLEQVSIDEAYLDVSTSVHDWNEARAYAHAIKREIREKEGLTCSIGIAPNKVIAKIASDFNKPDGLTLIDEEHTQAFLAPLPVKKIPGVGPKTEKTLHQLGIEMIEQLAHVDVQKLIDKFGKYGWQLHQLAHGIDDREVEEKGVRKSLGRERTFAEDTKDVAVVHSCVDTLAREVYAALQKGGFVFKTVAIKVKFDDFSVHTRAKTFKSFHSDLYTLTKTAKQLLNGLNREKGEGKQIRLVGVRVSSLGVVDEKQRRIV